jgi:phage-related protein
MGQYYFIWKGMDCRANGVLLSGPVPIIRPEERVRHVEIPGESGDLAQLEEDEDDPIYNSYIQTVNILARGNFHMREIYNWLRGSGFVTFHGEPDRRQPARIIGAITMSKYSKNSEWWTGSCQIYCQPLKELLTEPAVTITSSGSDVMNAGDVPCKPKIIATASGTEMTITVDGKTLTLTELTSGEDYIIDCRIRDVFNDDETVVLTADSSGVFPKLMPGSNTITGTGWSKLVIDRRQRFL